MKQIKTGLLLAALFLISLYSVDSAFANKASVTIDAPRSATRGSEILIKITVFHSANNFIHHVNWVYIIVNGREVARWEYSWNKLPEAVPLTKEIHYTVEGPVNIKAEANCNIHGSNGPALQNISVK